MIIVSGTFVLSNGNQIITGIKLQKFNFIVPCKFTLYYCDSLSKIIEIDSIVMDNQIFVDDFFDKIALSTRAAIDPALLKTSITPYLELLQNKS